MAVMRGITDKPRMVNPIQKDTKGSGILSGSTNGVLPGRTSTGLTAGSTTATQTQSAGTKAGQVAGTDYSALFMQRANEGAGYDELNQIAASRALKTATNPQYSQYSGDATQQAMEAYLAKIKPKAEVPQHGGFQSSGYGASSGYDMSEYIRRQKAAETEAALASLKGAYEKSIAGYGRTADSLGEQYTDAKNRAAAQAVLARKAFAEQAVASGLNTGSAGQAELAQRSVLQRELTGLDSSLAGQLADLDVERNKVQADYEAAIAKAQADGDASLANALYQELVRVQNLEREDQIRQEELAREEAQRQQTQNNYERELAAAQGKTDYAQALAKAQTLAAAGDFSGYRSLGYSDAEINSLKAAYERGLSSDLASTRRSTGTGSIVSLQDTTVPKVSAPIGYQGVREAAKKYTNQEEAKTYLEQMVDLGQITPDEAVSIYRQQQGIPTTYAEYVQKTGMSNIYTESEFNRRKISGAGGTGAYTSYPDYLAAMYAAASEMIGSATKGGAGGTSSSASIMNPRWNRDKTQIAFQ